MLCHDELVTQKKIEILSDTNYSNGSSAADNREREREREREIRTKSAAEVSINKK
jgi:hypothetical protein